MRPFVILVIAQNDVEVKSHGLRACQDCCLGELVCCKVSGTKEKCVISDPRVTCQLDSIQVCFKECSNMIQAYKVRLKEETDSCVIGNFPVVCHKELLCVFFLLC
jgi:hypothetical protein